MNRFLKSRFFMVMLVAGLSFLITACGSGEGERVIEDNAIPSPTPFPSMIADPVPTQVIPDEPIEDLVPPSPYTFSLNDEEKAVYESLKTQLTTDVFEGMDPRSVAKIYIQCGIDGEWEAEYTCHSKEGMTLTLDDWEQEHMVDLQMSVLESRASLANWAFPFLEDGEVMIDGNHATIIYHSVPYIEEEAESENPDEEPEIIIVEPTQEEIESTYNEFHLLQNDKGIWEVRFRPQAIN